MPVTFRSVLGLACLAALSGGARAAPAPSLAVVSAVVQQLQVVGFKEQVGSRPDSNLRTRIDTPGVALDKGALLAAQKVLESGASGAPVSLVGPLDVELFPAAGNPVVGQKLQIPADLAAGFLATCVDINVSLVDLRDDRVLATKAVAHSRLDIARTADESGHRWDSVSNASKMANLLRRVAVEQTVQLVMQPQR